MSDKINVGRALLVGNNLELDLNITELLKALPLQEVQLSLRNFVAKGGEPQQSVKLFIGLLEPTYRNMFQTHSVRIDTSYRQK